jgi:cell shape-determining protein MreC
MTLFNRRYHSRDVRFALNLGLLNPYLKEIVFFIHVIVVSFCMLYLSYNRDINNKISIILVNAFRPVVFIANSPIMIFEDMVKFIYQYSSLIKENKKLTLLNQFLSQKIIELDGYINDSKILVSLESFKNNLGIRGRDMKVIYNSGQRGRYLIATNKNNISIPIFSSVISNGAFIGRVISVHNEYVKIMLINNYYSKIPVYLSKSGLHGIMSGGDSLQIKYLEMKDIKDLDGDIVITSGAIEDMVAGIPVGIVKIDGDDVLVKPIINIDTIQYVSILDHINRNNTDQHQS